MYKSTTKTVVMLMSLLVVAIVGMFPTVLAPPQDVSFLYVIRLIAFGIVTANLVAGAIKEIGQVNISIFRAGLRIKSLSQRRPYSRMFIDLSAAVAVFKSLPLKVGWQGASQTFVGRLS